MAQTVALQLPDEMLQRCQRGATAARKLPEECLVDRLMEALPPSADAVPSPLREELRALEFLDDEALWQMAQNQLPPARQRLYSRLLTKQSQGTITAASTTLYESPSPCRSTLPLGTGWLASSIRRHRNVISRILPAGKRIQQR